MRDGALLFAQQGCGNECVCADEKEEGAAGRPTILHLSCETRVHKHGDFAMFWFIIDKACLDPALGALYIRDKTLESSVTSDVPLCDISR